MLTLKILMKYFSSLISSLLLSCPLLLSFSDYIMLHSYESSIILETKTSFYHHNPLFSVILLVFYLRVHLSRASCTHYLYILLYHELFKICSIIWTYFLFYVFSLNMCCYNILITFYNMSSFNTPSFSFLPICFNI